MEVFSSGKYIFLQSPSVTLIGLVDNLLRDLSRFKFDEMNAAIAQYRPIDNSAFLFSSKNPATGSIQMAKLVGENFEEMGAKFLSKFQNSFVIQPGVVFTWQKEREIFRGQLLTSIVSGFDEWNVLDEIEFTIPVTVSKLFSSF